MRTKCLIPGTRRVEDGRGDFRLSVAVGISFDMPPQSDLP
jgi:hypothetical protein